MATRRIKVLLLNYEYPPLGGGAANATAYLLKEFSRDPTLQVDLLTSSTGPGRVERSYDNVTIHYLEIGKRGDLHYQTSANLLQYSRKAFWYGRSLVKQGDHQLCHAFFGIPCGYVARGLGLPYVVSLRGSDVPFYNERFRYLDRLFFRRASRRVWRDAKRVVANSAGLRELALQTSPGQPIDVIPNGVDAEYYRPGRPEGGPLRVLCVTRLIGRKGVEYLIRAVASLRDARLTLVGSGGLERSLRTLARELGIAGRVQFDGYVPHDETISRYQAAHVFVLPSLNEGMSNTLLEALACGLPVIVTDTGGTQELVQDGQNGFVVPMRSAKSIVERLRRYSQQPGLREEHGKRSRSVAESMCWASVASSYKRVYEGV